MGKRELARVGGRLSAGKQVCPRHPTARIPRAFSALRARGEKNFLNPRQKSEGYRYLRVAGRIAVTKKLVTGEMPEQPAGFLPPSLTTPFRPGAFARGALGWT